MVSPGQAKSGPLLTRSIAGFRTVTVWSSVSVTVLPQLVVPVTVAVLTSVVGVLMFVG